MLKDQLYIKYGSDAKQIVQDILNEANILTDLPGKNSLIGIKPNLVLASPQELGATTSPFLVEGVLEYLKSNGYNNIIIMEGSWVGCKTPSAYRACGYDVLSKKYNVPLIDLQTDEHIGLKIEDVTLKICNKALAVEYMINMPVLKGHCQTSITCALKNLKGCIPDSEKRRYHTMGLHKPIAYLNKLLKQDLIVVDGIIGDLNFEEGGNPVQMNRVIVGKDPVLIDSYVSQLLGYDKSEIPYISMAEELGVGNSRIDDSNVFELNKDTSITSIPKTRHIKRLDKYVKESMACSSCYASLMHALDRLNDQGKLSKLNEKVYIGQGYKGKDINAVGIGSCTCNFYKSLAGCPPKAKDIIEFLLK
jgi:uncharacterized protein (DUF362 family)